MLAPMKTARSDPPRTLDRLNLRLPPEMFEALDEARGRRVGALSRNTWIMEAIQEKLARDAADERRASGK